MKMVVLAAAVVGGLLAVASPAQAEDTRPCVSMREFHGTPSGPGTKLTRRELEKRWDVRGLGVSVPNGRYMQWIYPACGYSPDEVIVSIVTRPPRNPRASTLNLDVLLVVRQRNVGAGSAHGHN